MVPDKTDSDILTYSRSQFPPLAKGWAYFENAGGSYVPRQVIERMTANL